MTELWWCELQDENFGLTINCLPGEQSLDQAIRQVINIGDINRENMAGAPLCHLQSLVLHHTQAFGKFINFPGKKKHCTVWLYYFSDVLVKAKFWDKKTLTVTSRSNLCTCQELKTGDGSHIRRNRQYIGRKIYSADSTAGAVVVTGSIFCYRWKSSFHSFLCSTLMLSVY